ncbi:cell division protease FtsH [Haloferula luteola]|uniref:ATP-dependent zinc metalloprotease FtsH n=1 Tax=Haloferula luteola TaxID=595692 RepID=A0A840VBN6_9BACT|nr:ATP-dependent zinc metalloprotease FtsH [Haloferula luteola]MBB5352088.1 cell division protease FtsH [Haloferula luteola]
MSDPSQNRNPQGPGSRGPNNVPGFNWRLALFLGLALLALGFAFFYGDVATKPKQLSFNEFTRKWDQGLIITGDSQRLLSVETADGSSNAKVVGWYRDKPNLDEIETQILSFQLNFGRRTDQEQEVMQALGEHLPRRFQSDALPTVENTDKTYTLSDFRGVMANGWVITDDPARPLELHTTNYDAVLTGYARVPAGPLPAPTQEQLHRFVVQTSLYVQAEEISRLLAQSDAKYINDAGMFGRVVLTFLPVLLIILLLFFLFRQQMKAAGRGAMSFGKSKARLLTRDHNKVTFKDVAGIQEAKEELWEIVDFLRDPRKFQKLGGSIPKGVLMVGPPGTGKTLLARAIAGEADVPFFSISGSDFVEMFVGVGASRVRDMFEQGKKHAPCLIFIDEIDAVGRHRGHGLGGGHDEREQTLNQLLVEMDGFDTQEGIIIIAATNRPDVLDPALLRPGRFDRQVTVSLPDVKGREQILGVHSKKIKLSPATDLALIARGTPGFSGAELANLINEAALLAARKGLNAVTLAELEEARDKVRWGRERRSLALSEEEKKTTAYHEAGHALLLATLEHVDPLHKVTIIPRGPYLGAAFHLPKEDKYHFHKLQGIEQLIVTMGGRVAEEITFGDVTSGASGDIRQATSLARRMVCEWGMSEELGMVEYGENQGEVFLARDISRSRNYSEATAQKIDSEIKRVIDRAYTDAKRILLEKRDKLELIAQALLEYETLDARHILDLIEFGEMKDPPNSPKPPSLPDEPPAKKKESTSGKTDEDDGGPLPGTVVGAPA